MTNLELFLIGLIIVLLIIALLILVLWPRLPVGLRQVFTERLPASKLRRTSSPNATVNPLIQEQHYQPDSNTIRQRQSTFQPRDEWFSPSHHLRQRIDVDPTVIELIQNSEIKTNRFIKKDFSELMVKKIGVRPRQMVVTLEAYLDRYPPGSKQRRILQTVINEIQTGGDNDDLSGKSQIENIACKTDNNELTATFMIYQYRLQTQYEAQLHEPKLVMDALIISGTQKLTVDWTSFKIEAVTLGVIGFLINPGLGTEELLALAGLAAHLSFSYKQIKSAQTENNAKALLFKMLIDRGHVRLENGNLYLDNERE